MVASSLRVGLAGLGNLMPGCVAGRLSTASRGARVMRPIVNLLLPDDITVVTVRQGRNRGARLPIYARAEKYYWTGTYEAELQETLWARLPRGGTFWDIGAHVGFFSTLASRRVGPNGHVLAVEPFAENLRRLEDVLALNGISNVVVLPLAILGQAGYASFLPSPASSMGSVTAGRVADGTPVSAQSLDALLERFPVPDIVKIDVEGAELDVLRGGCGLAAGTDAEFLVEFTDDHGVAEARAFLPEHIFEGLSDRHWLLRKAGAGST
jgi:FkbM family methyltransferase